MKTILLSDPLISIFPGVANHRCYFTIIPQVLGMGSVLYVLPRRFYGLMECHIDGQYSPGLSYRE